MGEIKIKISRDELKEKMQPIGTIESNIKICSKFIENFNKFNKTNEKIDTEDTTRFLNSVIENIKNDFLMGFLANGKYSEFERFLILKDISSILPQLHNESLYRYLSGRSFISFGNMDELYMLSISDVIDIFGVFIVLCEKENLNNGKKNNG